MRLSLPSRQKRLLVLGAFACAGLSNANADLANVFLKDGTPLRGDVAFSGDELVIRNAAGEMRYPRAEVERVEWLTPAATLEADYNRRLATLADTDLDGHLSLAEWAGEQSRSDWMSDLARHVLAMDPTHPRALELLEAAQTLVAASTAGAQSQPTTSQSAAGRFPPPPLLSDRDIQRLRLHEVRRTGAAEDVRVRFLRKPGETELERVVRGEIEDMPGADPQWDRILANGKPHEKLQVILAATDLEYADRIEVRSDPGVFLQFRRRVLPLLARGCARSGCHGSEAGATFRFPLGAMTGESVAYTSFALLDRAQTASGPLIDRDDPRRSILLQCMLPESDSQHPHPPVPGQRIVPPLRGVRDRNYEVVLEWIKSLRTPHPEYALDYQFPDWVDAAPKADSSPESRGRKQPPASRPSP